MIEAIIPPTDLSNYYTQTETNDAIKAITSGDFQFITDTLYYSNNNVIWYSLPFTSLWPEPITFLNGSN